MRWLPLIAIVFLAGLSAGAQAIRQQPDVDWDSVRAAIREDQRHQVFDNVELRGEMHLEQTKAITGDGAETIVADLGGLGASTDMLAIYRLDHGKITPARFKDRKGHIDRGGSFVSGTSAMHSSIVTLSAAQQTLFYERREEANDRGVGGSCEGHAYQWNSRLKMFVERASRATDEVRCEHNPIH